MSMPFLLAVLELTIFVALAGWAATLGAARAHLLAHPRGEGPGLAEREGLLLAEAERTAHLGSYALDPTTGALTCSDELRRLLQLGPGETVTSASDLVARVPAEDRAAVLGAWEEARTADEPISVEHRISQPGGARWVDSRVRLVAAAGTRTERVVGTMLDVSDRRAVESALAHQALHDSLTGLPNRAWFLGRLAQAMTHRRVRPSGLAVFFVDIDHFKWLNDSRGHACGDELLVNVGGRLRAAMRPGDTVARLGGDEFVVLCDDIPSRHEALLLAERLGSLLRRPVDVSGESTSITVSIGIAFLAAGDTSGTSETLLHDADAAMYVAKARGRDRHEVFDPAIRVATATRSDAAGALRGIVERGEVVVLYQPLLDLGTRRLIGFEALVRWDRPGRGLLQPAAFLDVAEETGLIVPIGADVLRTACRQVAIWQSAGHAAVEGDLVASVNLTRRQLLDDGLCVMIEAALVDSGLLPSQLHLEIPESVLLGGADADAVARALGRLRRLGVSIAVDDFGADFSSLTCLRRFPLDVLKIDPTFVKALVRPDDRVIVAGIVELAHGLGLTTLAEGVETDEQLDELRRLGCQQGQGYLWSRALPAHEAER